MPPSTPNSPRARPATPSARSRSTPCRWSSTSHAPRRIAPSSPKPGACPRVRALLDPAVHPAEIASRACMVLINCCTGEDAEATRVAVAGVAGGGAPRGDADPSRTPRPGVASRRARPRAPRGPTHGARDVRRDEGSFDALAALLEAGAPEVLAREAFSAAPTFVKHAATTANKMCADHVPNKVAFARAGGIPPLMRLMARGPKDPLTEIVVHAVSTLAMDNDDCDQVIADTGVLPRLVDLVGEPGVSAPPPPPRSPR